MSEATPDLRARLIGEILQHVAGTPEPVTYNAIFERALASSGRVEEEVSQDILHAVSNLTLCGMLRSNMFDQLLQELTLAADTTFAAGPRLLGFIWDEALQTGEEDEGEEA